MPRQGPGRGPPRCTRASARGPRCPVPAPPPAPAGTFLGGGPPYCTRAPPQGPHRGTPARTISWLGPSGGHPTSTWGPGADPQQGPGGGPPHSTQATPPGTLYRTPDGPTQRFPSCGPHPGTPNQPRRNLAEAPPQGSLWQGPCADTPLPGVLLLRALQGTTPTLHGNPHIRDLTKEPHTTWGSPQVPPPPPRANCHCMPSPAPTVGTAPIAVTPTSCTRGTLPHPGSKALGFTASQAHGHPEPLLTQGGLRAQCTHHSQHRGSGHSALGQRTGCFSFWGLLCSFDQLSLTPPPPMPAVHPSGSVPLLQP